MNQYIPRDLIKYVISDYIPHYIFPLADKNIIFHKHRNKTTIDKEKHSTSIYIDDKIISHHETFDTYITNWHYNKIIEIHEDYNNDFDVHILQKREFYVNEIITKKLKFDSKGNVSKKTLYFLGNKRLVKIYNNNDLIESSIYPPIDLKDSYAFTRTYYKIGYNEQPYAYNIWPKDYLKSENRFICRQIVNDIILVKDGLQSEWEPDGKVKSTLFYKDGNKYFYSD
jgi:hypothetical protein